MQLISWQEAEALMTVPPPSSPQSSSGSPGAPQHMSKPSHDFLRTGVTPQEDIKPLIANPGDVLSGQYLLNTDRMCLGAFPSLQQIGALSLHANLRINSAMSSQPKCIALSHIKGVNLHAICSTCWVLISDDHSQALHLHVRPTCCGHVWKATSVNHMLLHSVFLLSATHASISC